MLEEAVGRAFLESPITPPLQYSITPLLRLYHPARTFFNTFTW